MKLNYNFQRGGEGGEGFRGSNQKTLHGGGMDIFWNHKLLNSVLTQV